MSASIRTHETLRSDETISAYGRASGAAASGLLYGVDVAM